MNASPSLSYDRSVKLNDHVTRDFEMSSRNASLENRIDIGESDMTITSSSSSRPLDQNLSEFTSSALPNNHASPKSAAAAQQQHQNSDNRMRTQAEPEPEPQQDLRHHSAEVTDSSDSSGGTEGSKHRYGSPPHSIPLQNHFTHSNHNSSHPIQQQSAPMSLPKNQNKHNKHEKDQNNASLPGHEKRSHSFWSNIPQRKEIVLRRLSETLLRGSLTLVRCHANTYIIHPLFLNDMN